MLLSTTSAIEGMKVKDYLDIVAAEVVLGVNVLRDMWTGVRDFTGGSIGTMETALSEARNEAIERLSAEAESKGADAVIGVSIDYETLGKNGTILMVCATGTAVTVHPPE